MKGIAAFGKRCVVCNRRLTDNHKCPPKVLAAIEAAERRIENWYDPAHPSVPPEDIELLPRLLRERI